MKRRNVSKIILVALMLVALFMFSGCSNKNNTAEPNKNAPYENGDGVVNDMERDIDEGVNDVKNGVDDLTDNGTNSNTSSGGVTNDGIEK